MNTNDESKCSKSPSAPVEVDGKEVLQRHMVTKYRDGSIRVAALAHQPAAVDGAMVVLTELVTTLTATGTVTGGRIYFPERQTRELLKKARDALAARTTLEQETTSGDLTEVHVQAIRDAVIFLRALPVPPEKQAFVDGIMRPLAQAAAALRPTAAQEDGRE